MLRKKINHEKTLTVIEKQELRCMRADVVRLEAMLLEGVISRQEYNKKLGDINARLMSLEMKYGLR